MSVAQHVAYFYDVARYAEQRLIRPVDLCITIRTGLYADDLQLVHNTPRRKSFKELPTLAEMFSMMKASKDLLDTPPEEVLIIASKLSDRVSEKVFASVGTSRELGDIVHVHYFTLSPSGQLKKPH